MSGVYYEKEGVPVGPVSGPAFAALYESGAANDTTRVNTPVPCTPPAVDSVVVLVVLK